MLIIIIIIIFILAYILALATYRSTTTYGVIAWEQSVFIN